MALNKDEKLLVEAIDSMLKQDAKLGLAHHDADKDSSAERGFEYLHEQIDDLFAVKAAELVHAESVCQAFHRIHSYKYLDDPSFPWALEKLMVNNAVPAQERDKAIGFLPKIIDELKVENREWAERDAGFNPALDEIKQLSRPEQPNDFKIQERNQKRNIEKKLGRDDGRPGHFPNPPLPDDGDDAESNPPEPRIDD